MRVKEEAEYVTVVYSDNIDMIQYKNGRIIVKAYVEILSTLSNYVIVVVLVLLY